MGGLGPGIGGFEIVVIGLVALLVVGPKDLPVLMRRVGQMVAKARAMANEFRSSFDEMARQSELDDLRKEVEALRTGQGMYPLGQEAEAAFKGINDELNRPAAALPSPEPEIPAMTPAPDEWPDTSATPAASAESLEASPSAEPKRKRTTKAASAGAAKPRSGASGKTIPKVSAKTAKPATASKAKTTRKKTVQP